jgi:amidase
VPAGFVRQLPVGLTLMGRSRGEARLLALAYAFEQATRVRRAPTFTPTLSP